MSAYYNEVDAYAASWLRNLIAAGLVPAGDVDERSIRDVQPDDLRGYAQCHFFSGVGGWAYAARLAGWADERPLWTGSCPCQPFSAAGRRRGTNDERHLWPDFFRLIRAARPVVVMGEQVARAAGYGWFDGVRADLADEGYASRGVNIPACAVDAPHIRSRLYWLAVVNPASVGRGEGRTKPEFQRRGPTASEPDVSDLVLVNARHDERRWVVAQQEPDRRDMLGSGHDAKGSGSQGRNGTFWSDAERLACHDGKSRRAQPGAPLLVDGFPGRVALWSGFGNAVVPQVAAEVIGAFMDVAP